MNTSECDANETVIHSVHLETGAMKRHFHCSYTEVKLILFNIFMVPERTIVEVSQGVNPTDAIAPSSCTLHYSLLSKEWPQKQVDLT